MYQTAMKIILTIKGKISIKAWVLENEERRGAIRWVLNKPVS